MTAIAEALSHHGVTHCRVVRGDDVVYSSGPQDEPLPIHSIRKSIVSALFGQLIDQGSVRLDSTLAELGIDDFPPLTETEKSATLEDLLTSRSGVYLPLDHNTSFDVFTGAATPWPERESCSPGTQFHYNNWDFNVLGEVYQRVSGTALFVAVDRQLAQPLEFRDWDPLAHSRLNYHRDPLGATNRYPNYAMSLSVRDLSRFGQLYCNGGVADGRQLITGEWIRRSTQATVATGLPAPFGHYGYLWWVCGTDTDSPLPSGSFSALGIGGQTLTVIPSHHMVVVAMCDNRKGGNSRMAIADALVTAILELDTPRGGRP